MEYWNLSNQILLL